MCVILVIVGRESKGVQDDESDENAYKQSCNFMA